MVGGSAVGEADSIARGVTAAAAGAVVAVVAVVFLGAFVDAEGVSPPQAGSNDVRPISSGTISCSFFFSLFSFTVHSVVVLLLGLLALNILF